MPVWPGDPGVVIERRAGIDQGDAANVSHLAMGTHTGTHLDPPVHFIPGRKGVDELDLKIQAGDGGPCRAVLLDG